MYNIFKLINVCDTVQSRPELKSTTQSGTDNGTSISFKTLKVCFNNYHFISNTIKYDSYVINEKGRHQISYGMCPFC
jgi:hypothetical protein